ncbi:MAG: DpnI domain-containing protein [archaeon]
MKKKVVEKRNQLSNTARRHGWVGCYFLMQTIPTDAKIPIIEKGIIVERKKVYEKVKRFSFLKDIKNNQVSWITDVLNCIEKLNKKEFELKELYHYKKDFAVLHPNNSHIEEKIRQQLQILRDKGIIQFMG